MLHISPKKNRQARNWATLTLGVVMKRLIASTLLAACFSTAACSDMDSKHTSLQTIQVSSVHWDELAAASSAAHVTNNGLIMMR